ncbi:MAG: hypothetical protein J5986_07380 [Roseburia sp.]|nr:hypothetical protein [Roseburia sp.]
MEGKNRYEEMYEKLVLYEQKMHESNQKKIRIGLKCIWIIPLIFLFLLFWTESNKVVFLILWIASLFGIAVYLILVEYSDYNLQEKLSEITNEEREPEALLGQELDGMEENFKSVIRKIDDTLNAEKEADKEAEEKENA